MSDDMLGTFDGSKMQPREYSYLPPGWYKMRIVDAKAAPEDKAWNQEIDFQVLIGSLKGQKQQLRIFDNNQFLIGNVLTALGHTIPERAFKLKRATLVGKDLWVRCDDRPDKNDPSKIYTQMSRFENVSFKPPAEGKVAKPAAATPEPADDEGLEDISEDEL